MKQLSIIVLFILLFASCSSGVNRASKAETNKDEYWDDISHRAVIFLWIRVIQENLNNQNESLHIALLNMIAFQKRQDARLLMGR